jgi:hypothetical protein
MRLPGEQEKAIVPALALNIGANAGGQCHVTDIPSIGRQQQWIAVEVHGDAAYSCMLDSLEEECSTDVWRVEIVDKLEQLVVVGCQLVAVLLSAPLPAGFSCQPRL